MLVPDFLPVLSAGRHRSPQRGACFMEMASYLAGERWSDHPACTHPLLAAAARDVNDLTSDAARSRLALLVPSAVGLTSDDPHLEPRLVRAAAGHALPVAAEQRQRVLAVSVLTSDGVLAQLDGRDPARLEPTTRVVLEQAPLAAAWARRFATDLAGTGPAAASRGRSRAFSRYTAPRAVALAVRSVADAVAPDADVRLRALLTELIAVTAAHAEPRAVPRELNDSARWDAVVRSTGAAR